jgi:hypothetical protein
MNWPDDAESPMVVRQEVRDEARTDHLDVGFGVVEIAGAQG